MGQVLAVIPLVLNAYSEGKVANPPPTASQHKRISLRVSE